MAVLAGIADIAEIVRLVYPREHLSGAAGRMSNAHRFDEKRSFARSPPHPQIPSSVTVLDLVGQHAQGRFSVQTAHHDFEQTASFGAALNRRGERPDRGARVRLGFAVAGLAALVGWGVLDHVQTDPSANARTITSAETAGLDGHGKWTGYTSP
jgi:hypothetical protein